MSASVSSRELFDVSSTTGCVVDVTVPSSGIEIWKSESSSSSIASNSWSVLSISSISRTTGSSRGDRVHQRAGEQELLAEDVVLDLVPAGAVGLGLDAQQLLAVVPLVERLGLVEALVALQAHEAAVEVLGQRLGELGLADARRALDEDRLAEPRGEVADERGRLAGQVALAAQAGGDVVDGGGRDAHGARKRTGVECSPGCCCPHSAAPSWPSPTTRTPISASDPKPFVFLMAFGFIMAVAGHIVRAKILVGTGIAIVFLATFLLPLATNVLKSSQ